MAHASIVSTLCVTAVRISSYSNFGHLKAVRILSSLVDYIPVAMLIQGSGCTNQGNQGSTAPSRRKRCLQFGKTLLITLTSSSSNRLIVTATYVRLHLQLCQLCLCRHPRQAWQITRNAIRALYEKRTTSRNVLSYSPDTIEAIKGSGPLGSA